VSDIPSIASLTGFNFRDSRENFIRDAPMERKERKKGKKEKKERKERKKERKKEGKRLKTEWCPTAEETLFTV
jgi:hypothetical protein